MGQTLSSLPSLPGAGSKSIVIDPDTQGDGDEEDYEDDDEIDRMQRELFHTIDEESRQQVEDYKQACDNGKGPMAACFATGEYLGLFERKHKEAFQLFQNTCFRPGTDKSPNASPILDDGTKAYGPGCFNMAKMCMTGKGRRYLLKEKQHQNEHPVDYEQSYQLFDRACKAGHGGACHIQAKLLLTPPELMQEHYERSIQQFNERAGKTTTVTTSDQENASKPTTNIPYNPHQAMKIYDNLCQGTTTTNSDSIACFTLASMLLRGDKIHSSATYGSPQELSGQEPIQQRTNEVEDRRNATAEERFIERNPQRAKELLEYACMHGKHSASCFNLAVMFEQGDEGVPADKSKAEYYKDRTQELVQMFGTNTGQTNNTPETTSSTSFGGM